MSIGESFIGAFAFGALLLATPPGAKAQAIDPDTMTPRAAGTNLVETSLGFGHSGPLNFTDGESDSNARFNSYEAAIHLEHYFDVVGQRFAVSVTQGVGMFDSSYEIIEPGMRRLGATNTTLAAHYWPFVSDQKQAFVSVSAFLAPPDGSYNRDQPFNVGSGAWQGSLRLGGHKGFGGNFSVDASVDVLFTGDQPIVVSTTSTDPTYHLQVWANWDWANGVRTSLGYYGAWGGNRYYNEPSDMFFPGGRISENRSAEVEGIRAQVAYWWTPRIQLSLELAHDIATPGGYQQQIGALGKLRLLF